MSKDIDINFALKQEPKDAVKYFQDKGYKISWDWHDTLKESHAKAFTVAKMTNLDLLQDTKNMLHTAIKEGWTEKDFQTRASEMFKKRGWWGKQDVVNPKTGKTENVQLGSPYRVRTIYKTNMQTAYMAGRYKNQIENADNMPYWMYVAIMDKRTRPSHAALNGTILKYDDPFWDANYPPNGWNCRCRVVAVDDEYVQGKKIGTNKKPLLDYGWDYNVGKAWFQPDLNNYDYDIAKDYCTGVVTGPTFEYFYNSAVKNGPISTEENKMPVAVINEANKKALDTSSQVVHLSGQTLVKQINNHPEITLDMYKTLPDVIDNAQMIINQKGEKLVCIEQDKKYYLAVIKATKNKKELYLTSFRMTNLEDIKREAKKGEIIKNELY